MDSGSADLWVGSENCTSLSGGGCVSHTHYNFSGFITKLSYKREITNSLGHDPVVHSRTQGETSKWRMEQVKWLEPSCKIMLLLPVSHWATTSLESLTRRVSTFRQTKFLLTAWWALPNLFVSGFDLTWWFTNSFTYSDRACPSKGLLPLLSLLQVRGWSQSLLYRSKSPA